MAAGGGSVRGWPAAGGGSVRGRRGRWRGLSSRPARPLEGAQFEAGAAAGGGSMFPESDRTKPSTISLKLLSRKWFQTGFRAVARTNEAICLGRSSGVDCWSRRLGWGRNQNRKQRQGERLAAGWVSETIRTRGAGRRFQGRGQGREERHVSSGPVGFASSGCPAGLWWLVRSGERRPGEGGGV